MWNPNVLQLPDSISSNEIIDKTQKINSEIKLQLIDIEKTAKNNLDIFSGLPNTKKYTLEDIATIFGGSTPKGLAQQKSDGDIPFYKVSDMNIDGNEIYMTSCVLTLSSNLIKQYRLKTVPIDSVIFPKIGGAIATNKKRIIKKEGAIDANTMALIPKKFTSPRLLYFFMCTIDLAKYSNGSTMPQLNSKSLAGISIQLPTKNGIPDIEAQEIIADRLEESLSKIELLHIELENQMKLNKLLKQSLLSQAFEGKL